MYITLTNIATGILQSTPEQREPAMGMVQMEPTYAFIARSFGCSSVAVTNLMQRYKQGRQTGQEQADPE